MCRPWRQEPRFGPRLVPRKLIIDRKSIAKTCQWPARTGAPLRNRTVDLLLTMATLTRPQRTSCTDSTPERPESTECTHWTASPVHDSFHDLPGQGVTLGDREADGRRS